MRPGDYPPFRSENCFHLPTKEERLQSAKESGDFALWFEKLIENKETLGDILEYGHNDEPKVKTTHHELNAINEDIELFSFLAPKILKRYDVLLYWKIKFFGTTTYRRAKKVYDKKELPPSELLKLKNALADWRSLSVRKPNDCTCAEAYAKLLQAQKILAKIKNDIAEFSSLNDRLTKRGVSLGTTLNSLYDQMDKLKEKEQECISLCVKKVQEIEMIRSQFYEAIESAKTYKKHDTATKKALKHQTEIREVLK
jgi:hypothetical protein